MVCADDRTGVRIKTPSNRLHLRDITSNQDKRFKRARTWRVFLLQIFRPLGSGVGITTYASHPRGRAAAISRSKFALCLSCWACQMLTLLVQNVSNKLDAVSISIKVRGTGAAHS